MEHWQLKLSCIEMQLRLKIAVFYLGMYYWYNTFIFIVSWISSPNIHRGRETSCIHTNSESGTNGAINRSVVPPPQKGHGFSILPSDKCKELHTVGLGSPELRLTRRSMARAIIFLSCFVWFKKRRPIKLDRKTVNKMLPCSVLMNKPNLDNKRICLQFQNI